MNYIELVNNFWLLDEELQFTPNETRLYFYLLKIANRLGWVESFVHSDEKTSANVGISKNTLKTARKRLIESSLICFLEGGKGHANKSRYQILTPKLIPNLTSNMIPNNNRVDVSYQNLTPKPTPNLDPLLNKHKLNQTKENIKIQEEVKPPLNFPFSSDLFFKKWDLLTSSPVWSKKAPESLQLSLNTLSEYPEPFVLEMMNYAIESEWSMFKGIEMKRYFLEWQKQQKPEKPKPEKSTRFKPPKVEEVAAYCKERKNSIDPQSFIDFYQSRGWKYNNTKITDWQACVRTWEKKEKENKAPKVATKPEVLKASEDYGAKIQKQIAESKQRTAEIEAKRKQAKPLINIETIPEQILEKEISPEELAEIKERLRQL